MPSGRNKDAQPKQSHTMLAPDITKSGISWEEIGILSQMLNIPECDALHRNKRFDAEAFLESYTAAAPYDYYGDPYYDKIYKFGSNGAQLNRSHGGVRCSYSEISSGTM